MEDRNKALEELHNKIEEIARKQKAFQEEIQQLHNEIFKFDLSERVSAVKTPVEQPVVKIQQPVEKPISEVREEIRNIPVPPVQAERQRVSPKKGKSPIEEFIGTNLLNKIGIAILVIGIGFGAKYSIEHDLINPLTRIILGYFYGIALIVIAIRLKKGHNNFSAVLLSGGMAVMYFITFAAYDFYQLIPQVMAFVLMVAFTGFTVFAAMQYDREVIGIIGLTGAYAVPFLLSDGSGRVVILFSYITIINTGILVLAFKKYWKILYYIAFALTWMSFAAWFTTSFDETKHFWISLIFGTVFFVTFYGTFLAYKLIKKESLNPIDLILMLLNSFVYYGYGYATIDFLKDGDDYLGIFTVVTALMHFVACVIIYKQQKELKDIFYFLAGMVLIFLTIAVPVQLDGNWVTIVWAFEAALLFWIGRTKTYPTYEKISYGLIVLAFGSLLHDWGITYREVYYYSTDVEISRQTIFLNLQFLSTVLVVLAFAFVLWISKQNYVSPHAQGSMTEQTLFFGLPLLILFVTYVGIFKEIELFWTLKHVDSRIHVRSEYPYDQFNEDILRYKNLWLLHYSAIFALVLSIVQLKIVKNKYLMALSMGLNALIILLFVTIGLYELSGLRDSYLTDANNPFYYRTFDNISIRYLGLALIIPLMVINYRYMKDKMFPDDMRKAEQVLLHTAILVLLSSELVHWLEMARVENSFKLGLSILWGSYALFLIVLGLRKDLKHIRVSAIVLFAVTLIKLFVYDMADMSTIAKTIVMIILGALMLIASFLYNKVKRTAENES